MAREVIDNGLELHRNPRQGRRNWNENPVGRVIVDTNNLIFPGLATSDRESDFSKNIEGNLNPEL